MSGKVAFVTAAGRGIGEGIARAGADVVINSLAERYAVPLGADIARATGRRVMPLVADVTTLDQSDHMTGQTLHLDGGLTL